MTQVEWNPLLDKEQMQHPGRVVAGGDGWGEGERDKSEYARIPLLSTMSVGLFDRGGSFL